MQCVKNLVLIALIIILIIILLKLRYDSISHEIYHLPIINCNNYEPKIGDVIFYRYPLKQSKPSSVVKKVINYTIENISHVGVVVGHNGKKYIMTASPRKEFDFLTETIKSGVHLVPICDSMKNYKNHAFVYQIKKEANFAIPHINNAGWFMKNYNILLSVLTNKEKEREMYVCSRVAIILLQKIIPKKIEDIPRNWRLSRVRHIVEKSGLYEKPVRLYRQ